MFKDTINNIYINIQPSCNSSNVNISDFWLKQSIAKTKIKSIDLPFTVILNTVIDENKNTIEQTVLTYNDYTSKFEQNVTLTKSLFSECGFVMVKIIKSMDSYNLFEDVKWANSYNNMELEVLKKGIDEECDK